MIIYEKHIKRLVESLASNDAEDAWHILRECGEEALPYLVKQYEATTNTDIRKSIIQIISEYRSVATLSFLETRLADSDGEIWKSALDGLVILGRCALPSLQRIKDTASVEKREWIEEAIEQIGKESEDDLSNG
ncbi:MAG TPA: hypothetical protein VGR67_11495 [Candidatus Polarisedimenticolia bacterium]|jgi:HEAT repeat protein|nr:hypothetical protein [Candidatus Polarisedimenticolia bacterium]